MIPAVQLSVSYVGNSEKLLTFKQDNRKMSFQGLSIFHQLQTAAPNRREFQYAADIPPQRNLITEKKAISLQIMLGVSHTLYMYSFQRMFINNFVQ